MAIVDTGLFVPKFGGLFTAAEGVSPLASIQNFTLLAGPTGSVWTHWGHLSRENLPETDTDGGDTTTLSTWLQMNTDSETEESIDTTTYSLLQLDASTVAAAVALNGTRVSALELWLFGTRRFGIWRPSNKVALTGRPAPNGTDQYAEMKMALTVLQPATSIASSANPTGGIAPWPNATAPNSLYIDNTAFTAA